MSMTTQRQGEIALLYLKRRLQRKGVIIKPDMQRQTASEAKELGISSEETLEFIEILARELLEEAFKKKKHLQTDRGEPLRLVNG